MLTAGNNLFGHQHHVAAGKDAVAQLAVGAFGTGIGTQAGILGDDGIIKLAFRRGIAGCKKIAYCKGGQQRNVVAYSQQLFAGIRA